METLIKAIEIFAMVTGIAYVVLEIMQKNAMWVLGILTGTACAFSFGVQHIWASMGLNIYYVGMSVVGFLQWRKAEQEVGKGEIHLQQMSRKTLIWSLAGAMAGTIALAPLLGKTGDMAPWLDAEATLLSVVGTWWLAQSYVEEWLMWIAADLLSTVLCLFTGQYWLAILYIVYVFSAIYGYFHWKNKGKLVNSGR